MKKKSDNRYLKFEGTHKELGLQQGRACSEILKKTHAMIEESEEVKQIKPFFIPMSFAKWGFRQMMGIYFLSTLKKDAPSQFDKLQGIAEGSGQDIKHLLSLQWTELEMSKVNFEFQNCSAAGITEKRSITGEPIMIYNFDYPEFFSPLEFIRHTIPTNGDYSVIGSTNAALPGSHGSMNEHGLSITADYADCTPKKPQGRVPISMMIQDTLEKCKYTEDAIKFIHNYKYNGCGILLIGDSKGDIRALEISNTMIEERLPENGAIFHSNHFQTDRMSKINVPSNGIYPKNSIEILRGTRCMESTESRTSRGNELIQKLDKISDNDLVSIFTDHGPNDNPSDNTICRHSNYFTTTASIIFYPTQKKIRVLFGHPCEHEYRNIVF